MVHFLIYSGPLLSCVWNLRAFPEMHDGDSAPSCCAFTHRVAFEEGSAPVMAESGEELNTLLMKVKEESEKVG